ncbi:MAG: hypothetical protein Q8R93_07660 [Methylicorpusculum sp.]|nr:hypothetical protein [Methylicorpusculum sp.]
MQRCFDGINSTEKALFALITDVAPALIAGVRKPWMALNFDIGVIPIRLRGLSAPAIHKE